MQSSRRHLLTQFIGLVLTLPGINAFAQTGSGKGRIARWDDSFELAIDFEIAQPEGFRYHRPYVAVWIEDATGKSVRTLSLWVQTSRRGPRWIPDLRRWYQNEMDKEKAGGTDLVATVSSATRMPGKYSLVWDGKDDDNRPIGQGTYFVCIEAAREHGTYQLMRKDYMFTNKAFQDQVAGNVEIKGATIAFRKRK